MWDRYGFDRSWKIVRWAILCRTGAGALAKTNIMKRPIENKEREDRFTDEVVVDAYNEEERAMGWYYYAAESFAFPFKARCALKRSTSPLKVGDRVEVIGMAPDDDRMQAVMVLIKWEGEDLAVPLIQLDSPESTGLTRQVLTDWKYWVNRGYTF
jgi:hypothetical protein